MPALPWQVLWKNNIHKRDKDIVFYEPTHTYTVKGLTEGYISCTGFLHEFFGHFDPDAVLKKMRSSRNWPNSKYYGRKDEDIKAEWANNGRSASEKGTAMHLAIEQFLNGAIDVSGVITPVNNPKKVDVPQEVLDSKEWRYFLNFWRDYGNDLVPHRMEWEVWVEEIRLAGSIDAVFYRKSTKDYIILDWKRSKEIRTDNKFQTGLGPVSHLPDCNYWHYTLQLNVYRWILQTYYGIKISDLAIVIFHPDNTNYKKFNLNILDDEVQEMVESRLRACRAGFKEKVIFGDSNEDEDEKEEDNLLGTQCAF